MKMLAYTALAILTLLGIVWCLNFWNDRNRTFIRANIYDGLNHCEYVVIKSGEETSYPLNPNAYEGFLYYKVNSGKEQEIELDTQHYLYE